MKWFKHDADASSDAKIKKLVIRYGAIGYAIYFHCLELIAGNISETNITFELEHDAEIIADNLKIQGTADKAGVDIVNEVMKYIVQLGLFECHNDHIFCFKMLKRLDSSMTSSSTMRSLIVQAKESHDIVMTESCKTRLDKTTTEEKRTEQKDTIAQAFIAFWEAYPRKKSRGQAEKAWLKVNPSLYPTLMASLEKHKQSADWLKEGGQFIPYPATWLNAKGWEDEIEENPVETSDSKLDDMFAEWQKEITK